MTGAGYRTESDAAEIEKIKKGETVEAKQGIYYKDSQNVAKAKNVDTNVVWKAAVEGEEEGSASLIPALGAIAFAIATLAF